MLHQLVEYATAQGIAGEAGFTPKLVRWLITFSPDGKFLGVVDLSGGERKSKGREFPRAPHLKFSGDTPMRQFLVDTAKFAVLLGEEPPGDDASEAARKAWDKLLKKREYFLNLLKAGAEADPFLGIVADQLADPEARDGIRAALENHSPKAKPIENVTFAEVTSEGVRIVVELDHWHDWWRAYFPALFAARKKKEAGRKKGPADNPMRCFLSGRLAPATETHPKVTGLADVGANAGPVLVGFNEPAFRSYGLQKSANSAMCEEMAQQYVAGLNVLISDRRHSVKLAGAKVVYWYIGDVNEDAGENPFAGIFDPTGLIDPADDVQNDAAEVEIATSNKRREYAGVEYAKELLNAIRSGKRPELKTARYCALTLSGNKARVVVEDWMEGQFDDLLGSVLCWFDDLAIVKASGRDTAAPPPIERVVTCLLPERKPRQKYEDWIKPVKAWRVALWKCATLPLLSHSRSDDSLPDRVVDESHAGVSIADTVAHRAVLEHRKAVVNGEFAAALSADGENRAIRRATLYARMGLMKAWLLRHSDHQGDCKMEPILKEDHPSPVYQFGRLVAVLAELQREALRSDSGQEVKTSIIDRYYTAASTTPRLMLGRLIALSNHHLRKLEQTESGQRAAGAIRRRIASINARIDDSALPSAALLEDQTLFALGYYQQIAHMHLARAEASEKKKQKASS